MILESCILDFHSDMLAVPVMAEDRSQIRDLFLARGEGEVKMQPTGGRKDRTREILCVIYLTRSAAHRTHTWVYYPGSIDR